MRSRLHGKGGRNIFVGDPKLKQETHLTYQVQAVYDATSLGRVYSF
jgi:hypothetical protein